MRKSWFTLVEVLIVLLIVSTGLFTIISWASTTTTYVSEMKQKTIALNLAKEWVEAMYNLRDTNWRKRSNQKDMCWLAANPMAGWDTCWNWLTPWRWYWSEETTWWNTYYNFKEFTDPLNPAEAWKPIWTLEWESKFEDDYAMLVDRIKFIESNQSYASWTISLHLDDSGTNRRYWTTSSIAKVREKELALWEYYRYIAVDWVYDKDTGTTRRQCTNGRMTKGWSSLSELEPCWTDCCWNDDAKEFRFCSVVVYTRPFVWRVQVCSIMTNFTE